MNISVVIPAYNEEARIGKTLASIIKYLKQKHWDAEILVVDDGSTDSTKRVVQDIAKKSPVFVKLIAYRSNKGKGYAVKQGMLQACYEWILMTDSDLATPIEELDRFLKYLQYDIIIGSRAVKGADVTTQLHKRLLGRMSNFIINLLAVKGVKDTQCGFKLYTRDAAHALFRLQTLNRFGFDFEILHLAQRYGFSIKEVPVHWVNQPGSKVKAKDYFKTLMELFRIRWYAMHGVYPKVIR